MALGPATRKNPQSMIAQPQTRQPSNHMRLSIAAAGDSTSRKAARPRIDHQAASSSSTSVRA